MSASRRVVEFHVVCKELGIDERVYCVTSKGAFIRVSKKVTWSTAEELADTLVCNERYSSTPL